MKKTDIRNKSISDEKDKIKDGQMEKIENTWSGLTESRDGF